MRLFKTTFGSAAAGSLLLATFLVLSPNASAVQAASDCNIDGNAPSFLVNAIGQPKLAVNGMNSPVTVSDIPAGKYRVVGSSFDDLHPNEPDDQPKEQWYAIFYDAVGAIIGDVSVGPDLPTDAQSKSFPLYQGPDVNVPEQSLTAPFTLRGTATSVVFKHAFRTSASLETVFATCIGLSPLSVPQDTTTTTTSTTTTLPVLEPTTTTTTLPVLETTTPTLPETVPDSVPVVETTSTTTTTSTTSTTTTLPTTTTTVAPTTVAPAPVVPVLLPVVTTAASTTLSPTTVIPAPTTPPVAAQTTVLTVPASVVAPASVAAVITLPLEVAGVQVSAEEVAYTGSSVLSILEASVMLLTIGALLLIATRRHRSL